MLKAFTFQQKQQFKNYVEDKNIYALFSELITGCFEEQSPNPRDFIIKKLSKEVPQSLIFKKLASENKDLKKKLEKQELKQKKDLKIRDKIIKKQMARFMRKPSGRKTKKRTKCFNVVFEASVDKELFQVLLLGGSGFLINTSYEQVMQMIFVCLCG